MRINKKLVSSALALSLALGTFGAAAKADEVKIKYNDEYNTPSYIVEQWAPTKKGLSKRDVAFSYLDENSEKFKLKGDMKKHFKVTEEETDKVTGTHHIKLVEQYEGIPIFGSDSAIALDRNNNVTSFFGQVVPNLENENIETVATISKEQAIEIAKQAIEKKIGKVDQYDGDIDVEQFIYEFEDTFYNSYLVKASTVQPEVGYWHYFVDVTNGNVVDKYNAAHNVAAFGKGLFDNKQKLEVSLSGVNYLLNDITRGKGIITYDQTSGTNVDVTSLTKLFLDPAAIDAHAYAADTYDYYKKTFDRNSYDDNGAQLLSQVHVGDKWNNASWNGRSMSYGDGDGILYNNFAGGVDVIAHELTHAVTSATSNLIYRNESGALNESMSDIFGAMVDRDDDEWLIGEKLMVDPEVGNKALRSMSDPSSIVDLRTESGFSPDHWSKRYTGNLDGGGVHINSSINNKAAYLMSEGGQHYGVTVSGVGREATEQIYYRANTKYLIASSNFVMMRAAAIQSATDLFGSNSNEVKAVQQAYTAVGVN